MARKVFISYRHADTEAIAGRISDGLRRRLPRDHVFFDVRSIQGGDLFRERIERAVDTYDTMIVMIGTGWLGQTFGAQARIWEPDDYVRLEVGKALARDTMQVIPILVEGANVPVSGDLPPNVRGVLDHNMMHLANETFERDFEALFARTQGKTLDAGRLSPLWVMSAIGIGGALGCGAAIVVGVLHWLIFRRALSQTLGGNDIAEIFLMAMIASGAGLGFAWGRRRSRSF